MTSDLDYWKRITENADRELAEKRKEKQEKLNYWEEQFLEFLNKTKEPKIKMDAQYVNHAEIKLKDSSLDNRFFHVLSQLTDYYLVESTCAGFRITLDAKDNVKKLLEFFVNKNYPDPTPK